MRIQYIVAAFAVVINPESRGDCVATYSIQIATGQNCGLGKVDAAPYGLTEGGLVVGSSGTCSQGFPFQWTSGPLVTVLPVTGGGASDVNSKLQIVGVKPSPHVGFLYDNGTTTEVGMLPGCNFAEAYAINEAGAVVGYANNVVTGPLQAFLWQDGVQEALPLSGGPNSVAYDINDSGQIVGWMGPGLSGEAFLWENGKTIALGFPPGGVNSQARAISNNGRVCGSVIVPNPNGGGLIRHAAYWFGDEKLDLGTLPGLSKSLALDVNDAGQVVGSSETPLPSRAFLWQDGVMYDLNNLIPPVPNMTLRAGRAINSKGQIVCLGDVTGGPTSYYITVLLTPTEPTPYPSKPGDTNCDKNVDVDDLLTVINSWGKCPANICDCDFTSDEIINVDDLLVVINNWTF